MDAVSPAVTAVTAGSGLPAPSGFVTGTLATPIAPAALITPTAAAAITQVGATYGYVIVAGDTLFSIALANNTDVETIRRLNNLPDDTIQVGQVLIVPGTGAPTAQAGQDGATPEAEATPASTVGVHCGGWRQSEQHRQPSSMCPGKTLPPPTTSQTPTPSIAARGW